MKKKTLFKHGVALLVCSCCCVGLTSLSACKPEETPPPIIDPSAGTETVTLSAETKNMTVGDIDTLTYDYTGSKNDAVSWESSDESIVTVNGGSIEAINEGTASVTVTCGTSTASCQITVAYGSSIPELVIVNGLEENYTISRNSELSFNPAIKFRGREFTDGTFEIVSDNPSVVEVVDGVLKSTNELGEANITIKASWRKFTSAQVPSLQVEFKVTVDRYIYVTVDGFTVDEIELYSTAEFAGESFQNSIAFANPSVYEDGVKVEGAQISVTVEDETVVELTGGMLIGKTYGDTTVTLSYESYGNTYTKQYTVHVNRPIAKFEKKINYFCTSTGMAKDETDDFKDKTLAEMLGASGETLIDAYEEGLALTILEDGTLSGITASATDVKSTVITIGTAQWAYEVEMDVYAAYIYDAEDLRVFTVKPDEATGCGTQASGYYALGRNIDATDLELEAHTGYRDKWYPTPAADKGLTGTFDGRGYTIYNLTTKGEGLFSIVNGGTIKNVAFVNAKIEAGGGYIGFLAHQLVKCNLSNVYVQITSINGTKTAKDILCNAMSAVNIENLVVECSQKDFAADSTYTFFGKNAAKGKWVNIYLIGSTTLVTETDENLKSYATVLDMANANNDLSTFAEDVWVVANGVAYWKGFTSNDFAVATTTDGEGNAFKNEISFSLTNNVGTAVSLDATVSFVNATDADDFTIDGNVLTKKASCQLSADREIALKLTVQFGTETIEKVFTVTAVVDISSYAQESITGLYVEADGTIVGLTTAQQEKLAGATYKTAADGVAIAYTEGKLNTSFLSASALGAEGTFVAISAKASTVYTLSYRYVTKAIDEAEDLKMFTFSAGSTNTNDGYYVLTKDIDASALVLNAHAGFSAGYPSVSDKGLSGTLDGQGYVISNLTVKASGLFGVVNGGTIKNIAFVNGKVADTGYSYITFFAHWLFKATLSNVYVQVTDLDLAGNSTWGRKDVLCNNMSVVNMENVVIECTQTSFVEGKTYSFFGSNAAAGTWKNVYLVGASTIKVDKDGTTTHKELKVYESTSGLVSAGNDLSGFTATYWDTTSGAPVWKRTIV